MVVFGCKVVCDYGVMCNCGVVCDCGVVYVVVEGRRCDCWLSELFEKMLNNKKVAEK